jgi:hypothetical protein
MLYWIAAESDVRSEEVQSLTRKSLKLSGRHPAVMIQVDSSKHRRVNVRPVHPAMSALLQPSLAGWP